MIENNRIKTLTQDEKDKMPELQITYKELKVLSKERE